LINPLTLFRRRRVEVSLFVRGMAEVVEEEYPLLVKGERATALPPSKLLSSTTALLQAGKIIYKRIS
jgi:hypothetical protein